MYTSYLRQSQRRMFEVKGASRPATPSGCSPGPPSITSGERGAHTPGERGAHIPGERGAHIAGERGANTPTITVTTSSPIPPAASSPPPPQEAASPSPPPTRPIPILLEPSRVEGNSSPVSLSLQPPSLKGKLPPVASASQMQTVFDSNGVFTITRPHSVISQQPLTILPLEEDSAGVKHNNNNTHMYTRHTDSSSKYDRVTLSSSGSDRSRSVVPVSEADDHHTSTRRDGCCDRLCDSVSVLCCLLCDCRCGHCDLCCLLCRICIAV